MVHIFQSKYEYNFTLHLKITPYFNFFSPQNVKCSPFLGLKKLILQKEEFYYVWQDFFFLLK